MRSVEAFRNVVYNMLDSVEVVYVYISDRSADFKTKNAKYAASRRSHRIKISRLQPVRGASSRRLQVVQELVSGESTVT